MDNDATQRWQALPDRGGSEAGPAGVHRQGACLLGGGAASGSPMRSPAGTGLRDRAEQCIAGRQAALEGSSGYDSRTHAACACACPALPCACTRRTRVRGGTWMCSCTGCTVEARPSAARARGCGTGSRARRRPPRPGVPEVAPLRRPPAELRRARRDADDLASALHSVRCDARPLRALRPTGPAEARLQLRRVDAVLPGELVVRPGPRPLHQQAHRPPPRRQGPVVVRSRRKY